MPGWRSGPTRQLGACPFLSLEKKEKCKLPKRKKNLMHKSVKTFRSQSAGELCSRGFESHSRRCPFFSFRKRKESVSCPKKRKKYFRDKRKKRKGYRENVVFLIAGGTRNPLEVPISNPTPGVPFLSKNFKIS